MGGSASSLGDLEASLPRWPLKGEDAVYAPVSIGTVNLDGCSGADIGFGPWTKIASDWKRSKRTRKRFGVASSRAESFVKRRMTSSASTSGQCRIMIPSGLPAVLGTELTGEAGGPVGGHPWGRINRAADHRLAGMTPQGKLKTVAHCGKQVTKKAVGLLDLSSELLNAPSRD